MKFLYIFVICVTIVHIYGAPHPNDESESSGESPSTCDPSSDSSEQSSPQSSTSSNSVSNPSNRLPFSQYVSYLLKVAHHYNTQ
uniref:Putative secreted protein n=1 Tax=Panstrongylus lignarius TaxID=156445 RepID=A0A224XSG0_9HEMI